MKKICSALILFLLLFSGCRQEQAAGNEVRVLLPQDPESLNPVSYTSKNAAQLINLLFQSLLTVDLADGKLKPLLAETLPEIVKTDSASFITYRIRPEAAWANGKPVTAADVAFTLKVLKAPLVHNEKLRPEFEFVKDIRTDARDIAKFTLVCDPFAPEYLLLSGDFFILPQYLFDPENLLAGFALPQLDRENEALATNAKIRQFADNFNGSGFTREPHFLKGSAGYELLAWETGKSLRFQRKPDWWGSSLASKASWVTAGPEKINFKIIPDNAAALLTFRQKQLDVWANIPVPVFRKLQEQAEMKDDFQFFTPQTYSLVYFGFNARNPKFADKRTRQALAHLFDLKNIIRLTQGDLATPTVGPVSPENEKYYNRGLQPYAYNSGQAVKLLEQAGWQKNGSGWHHKSAAGDLALTLQINYAAGNSEYEQIALIFQQAAAGIGVPVTLQPLEGGLLSKKLKSGDSEGFIRSLAGNPFIYNFRPVFHTESIGPEGLNYTAFGNPETDKLIEDLYETPDENRKTALLHQLQAALHEESNLVFLYFQRDRLAVHKRFNNLKVSGIKPGYDVSAFRLKSE